MSLGIDFGYSEVKIIELESKDNNLSIKNIGKNIIYDDINKFDPEKISKAQWVGSIQNLCKNINILPKKIKKSVSSISGNNIAIQQLTTLEMSSEELNQSLEFEAKKHIPLDGTDAIIDYHILGQNSTEIDKINLLLVATTKNIISQHNDIVKDSGFKSIIFDADPIALINSYIHNYDTSDEGADVILNIGNQTSTLVVTGSKLPFFTREINVAGYHFTKYIMDQQNINYKDAENYKFENGCKQDGNNISKNEETKEFDLQIAEKSIYTNLVDEIRKTLRYYVKSNNQVFFNKFFLSGGSASLPHLKEFITENLNVKVELFNPFQKIKSDIQIDNPSQFAIAVGLAIRSLEEK